MEALTKTKKIKYMRRIVDENGNVLCPICGQILKEAEDMKDESGNWDGHSYRCDCAPNKMINIK